MAVREIDVRSPLRLDAARVATWAAAGAILLLLLAREALPWATDYPKAWTLPLAQWLDQAANWMIFSFDLGLFTFKELTRGIAWLIGWPLGWVEAVLVSGVGPDGSLRVSWLAMAVLAALAGHYIKGWRLAALAAGGVLYLAIFGQWEGAMWTLSVVLVCVPLAAIIGLLLGILATRRAWLEAIIATVMDLMQSIPHYAYFVPVVFFFGIGTAAGVIATIIFAIPPMVRCTILGLKRVPNEVLEAGIMAGTTPQQQLLKVELPYARPTLMVGLNQVIMQTLGMVVIASLIGVKGLGYNLLFSLQNLKLGQALEQGLAIVVIAIVLDRLSQAYATEAPWLRHKQAHWAARNAHLLLAAGALLLSFALSPKLAALQSFPESWTLSTAAFWDGLIRGVTDGLYGTLKALRDFLVIYVFLPVKKSYQWLPWPVVVLFFATLGYRLGGWRLASLVAGLLLVIVISGYWPATVLTAYLVTISVLLCVIIGVPIGILAASNPRANTAITLWCDTFQTFPSFVYLIPVVMLFKVGDIAAVMAVVIWAVIPIIRYTNLGLRNVPEELIEAAVSVGCTRRQMLWRVQLPVALPEILLGLNQTIMFALFMVIIAALIGTQDLGRDILLALSYSDIGGGVMAGLCIAFIGIISDRLIGRWSEQRKQALGLA